MNSFVVLSSMRKKKKHFPSAAECHRRLCDCLSHNVISLRTVKEWYHKFRSGDLILEDSPHCGRPTLLLMTMICAKHYKKIIVLQVKSLVHSSKFVIQQFFKMYKSNLKVQSLGASWIDTKLHITRAYESWLVRNCCRCIVNNRFLIRWLLVMKMGVLQQY